ncbi:uncharacterized protein LOC105230537 [Bactrocera dorsalis]|uniref:Uncharacterized protein LOC105230537 n=1 Tax=Bactrocera dorsalis TaxID=27457 RepID=A0ABM3JFF9_BACDO|nr:uncharacterized protein LOC105230537 [Bactrocera dorsalis]
MNPQYIAIYLTVLLVTSSQAGDTTAKAERRQILDARNRLIDIVTAGFYEVVGFEFEESEKLCRKIIDENKYENAPSEISKNKKLLLKDCTQHAMELLSLATAEQAGYSHHALFVKYGLKEVVHAVNRKRRHLVDDSERRIDEFVNSLTPKQQRKAIARNLARWSAQMKRATKVTRKMFVFRSFLRFYYFEGGI